MHRYLQPALYALCAIGISDSAYAQQLEEMGVFLKGVLSNPARAQDARFHFPAYVKDISLVTTQDGAKVAVVVLGNDNLNGVILTWGTAKLGCAMPIKEAAKLDKKQKVDVVGEVINLSTKSEYNQLARGMIEETEVLARCQIASLPTTSSSASAVRPVTPSAQTAQQTSNASSTSTAPTVSTADTLCSGKEKVVFSCSIGKKVVSVCEAEGASGRVQYRFGPLGAPELVWPENPASRQGVTAGSLMYSGGGGAYIRFAKSGTRYVVYSGEGQGWSKEGVAVEQGSKITANLPCKGPSVGGLSVAGLPEDREGFEIP
jgi:hypothetical protein